MTRKEARDSGAMFYTGKVCPHHPKLKGERRTRSANCHACVIERMQRTRTKQGRDEVNRYQRERRAAMNAGTLVPRKYRKANKEAAGAASTSGGKD